MKRPRDATSLPGPSLQLRLVARGAVASKAEFPGVPHLGIGTTHSVWMAGCPPFGVLDETGPGQLTSRRGLRGHLFLVSLVPRTYAESLAPQEAP